MNVNETDIVQGGSTLSRLWYQATGRSWEAQAEGGPTAEFDTQIGTDLNGLKVKIQYQQDLHGYDHPWPAGGGQNILNPSSDWDRSSGSDITIDAAEDGTITLSGTAAELNVLDSILSFPAGTYTFSGFNTSADSKIQIYIIDSQGAVPGNFLMNAENKTVTLTAENELTKFRIRVLTGFDGTFTFKPMIVSGETAPTSWSPYENECPIIGYDEAEIYLEPAYNDTADPRYTIDLDDTRYSGTLDVTTGEMVLDMAIVDLGTLTWRYNQASLGGFDTDAIASVVAGGNNAICSVYPKLNIPMTTANITANDIFFRINKTAEGTAETGNFGIGSIFVKDTNYSDADTFKTAMDGVQLLYELAEPVTVQLDPTTVQALTGHNVLWCNTGDVISVDYNII